MDSGRPELQAEGDTEEPCPICGKADDFRKHLSAFGRARPNASPTERPPDRETLGQHTWTFLHTMAAYYPNKANAQVQNNMHSMIERFADFYPCQHCAQHLRQDLKRNPPSVESREDLSQWFCHAHNRVNQRLGKPLFDCSQVLARWRASVSSTSTAGPVSRPRKARA